MARSRLETWLAAGALGVGLLLLGLAGLWVFMSATATPLHPEAQRVVLTGETPPPSRWASAVDQSRQILRAHVTNHNLPGLSVAVAADGELVWAEGAGWADLEQRIPVAPHTRFRLGTASVVLTSAAVGRLLEDQQMALDTAIQAYVPDFPRQPWPITVRHLMAHLSGVANDSGDEGPLFERHCARPTDGVDVFADRPLLFEPGTAYRYSSYGWMVVSAAVEAAADEPFLAFMQREIFDPLEMHDTTADPTRAEPDAQESGPRPNLATSYFPRFAADPRYGPDVMRPIDSSCYAGAGVFLSTPSDLVRFALAIDRGTLLAPDTVRTLQTPQRLSSGQETGYALGWDLEAVSLAGAPTSSVGHDGDVLGGPVASLLTFPDHRLVVAVLSNISYAEPAAMARQVAEAFASARRR